MIGIYKIENLINHKCYIGQSKDIYRRWNDHKRAYNNKDDSCYDYPIYRAIRKYGIENFSFEILECCLASELNQNEKKYIKKYDSFFNGYNQTFGGDGNCAKPKESIIKIFDLLINTQLTHPEIARQCDVSRSLVQSINAGRVWHNDDFTYPLQQGANKPIKGTNKPIKKEKCQKEKKVLHKKEENNKCPICGNHKNKKSKVCKHCIKKISENKNKPSKEELFDKLVMLKNFELIGRQCGVSGNMVKKWCKQYGIPYRTSDYKKIHENSER